MQTKTELFALVKSIHVRGKKLEKDVQIAAIGAIYYSVCYGDVTIGERLIPALGAGTRKQLLVTFLEKYGQFAWNKEAKKMVYRKNGDININITTDDGEVIVKDVGDLHEDAEMSEAYVDSIKEFWTAVLSPEALKSAFDCEAEVGRFIKRMEKAILTGQAENSDVFDYVSKAYNEYVESKDDEADKQEALQQKAA